MRRNALDNTALRDRLQGLNIYLVGLMGVGKTTVGQEIATQLGYRFLDTDALVEQAAGQSIADLFATVGEAEFRNLETQVLAQVCAYTRLAIATGGGIVGRPLNWSYLRHGVVVWLDVPIEVLVARLQADTTRPLLQGTDLAAKLQSLWTERQPLYAQADVRIGYTPGDTPERLTQTVLDQIQGILKPPPPTAAELVLGQERDRN